MRRLVAIITALGLSAGCDKSAPKAEQPSPSTPGRQDVAPEPGDPCIAPDRPCPPGTESSGFGLAGQTRSAELCLSPGQGSPLDGHGPYVHYFTRETTWEEAPPGPVKEYGATDNSGEQHGLKVICELTADGTQSVVVTVEHWVHGSPE